MAYTKAEIRGLVQTEVLTYLPTIKLDPRTIDFNVKRAEMDVYLFYSQIQDEPFLEYSDFADGDDLPERFDFIANAAKNADGKPASWLPIENVPFRKSNQYDLATTDSVSYSICNQKWLIIPNSETINIGFYQLPLDLSDPTVVDSTASSIPEELSGLVTLGAAKYCMQTIVDFAEQLQLSEQDRKNASAAIDVFGGLYQQQQQLSTKLL